MEKTQCQKEDEAVKSNRDSSKTKIMIPVNKEHYDRLQEASGGNANNIIRDMIAATTLGDLTEHENMGSIWFEIKNIAANKQFAREAKARSKKTKYQNPPM